MASSTSDHLGRIAGGCKVGDDLHVLRVASPDRYDLMVLNKRTHRVDRAPARSEKRKGQRGLDALNQGKM